MVRKAHAMNLTAGFYMNNCICTTPLEGRGRGMIDVGNESAVSPTGEPAWPRWVNRSFIDASWHGNVRFLKEGGWDSVKIDMCETFEGNTSLGGRVSGNRWADLLLAAKLPIVLESCNDAV